ncbi:WD repeat-containing protein 11-like [Forsythia ovata]|uniref:WD repeat-containing protein 11-like n=1 Tax=Forsythia ovata TaxID=205694 RepID=A0ABD1PJ91_9LAMI
MSSWDCMLPGPPSKNNGGAADISNAGLLAYAAGNSVTIVDVNSMQLVFTLPLPPHPSSAGTTAAASLSPFITAVVPSFWNMNKRFGKKFMTKSMKNKYNVPVLEQTKSSSKSGKCKSPSQNTTQEGATFIQASQEEQYPMSTPLSFSQHLLGLQYPSSSPTYGVNLQGLQYPM